MRDSFPQGDRIRAQFTSAAFTSVLERHEVRISMDRKGRWIRNVFMERFWR
ncbi:MAG: hypothetical protein WD273_09385 [Trueperaceae bacterium]